MSVVTTYASRMSGAGAGAGTKSALTKQYLPSFLHTLVFLAFTLSRASWPCLGAESNAQPQATSQIEATNLQELVRAYSQLREQLHATQLAIEQNRQEAKDAAIQNAEALSNGLQSLQAAFSAERARELEAMQNSSQAMQKSNKVMLIGVGAFAAMSFLTMLILTGFQWRTSRSLAEISAALPVALGLGPGAAATALGSGDSGLMQGASVEQSNLRLLASIERLKGRLQGLGQRAQVEPKPGEGTNRSGGNGDFATPSNQDSGARRTGSNGADEHTEAAELLSQARCLLDVDDTEAALACLDKVLALEPDNSEALVKKGATLERLHKLNEAIECYDRAIAVDGSMTIAYLHKGGLCNRLERFKEALECYEQALRTHEEWGG